MKYLILILTLGLTSSVFAETVTANDYFKAGEAALKKGDMKTAQSAYRKALQLNPNHGNANFRLKSMKNLTADARVRVRKERLKTVILANVTFEDLTLEECLEALGVMIEKASDDTFVPNFVLEDPDDSIAKNEVSIRLRNIPASEALKYVLSQGRATANFDAHVITVRPQGGRKAAKATTVVDEAKE